jgi:biopolymer transport protein ExbD
MAAHHHLGADKVVKGEVPTASSDMNVTPLIDVLLVLLVIFMAALPMTQKGTDINLPLESGTPDASAPPDQIVVEITADHRWPESAFWTASIAKPRMVLATRS